MIANTLPLSLQNNPRLDKWLAFLPGGRVRLSVGKVELGQGIMTALAQIAAEELDVGLGRLDIVAGDTDAAPDEGTTSGSMSLEVSGASVRIVCAETRSLMLGRAAELLGCPAASLGVQDGAVLRGGAATGQDYWSLHESVSLDRDVTGSAPAKSPNAYRVVGTDVARLDLPAKLHGGGFVHDMALPGMLHARVLRQPRRGAELAPLDLTAIGRARALHMVPRGNYVALVAKSEAVLARVVAAAAPQWSGGVPISAAMQEAEWLRGEGATETLFGAAARDVPGERVAAEYSRPYIAHAAMGPSCAVAQFDGEHLTVWSHTQGVYPLRQGLATLTGLKPSAISVRHVQGPGCYGHNGADDVAVDAALVAHALPGAPIRVQWTREEEFGFEPASSAMLIRLEAVLDAAGRPIDWTTEIWSAPHTARGNVATFIARQALPDPPELPVFVENPPANGGGATRNAIPLYDVPAHRIQLHLVQRPPVRTSALRGLGALPNVFALEGFIDELAARIGADPVAYRLALLSDPRGRAVIETVAAMADWPNRRRGTGIGFARYKNRSAYAAVIVELDVDKEVRLRRVWCAADAGLVVNPDGLRNQLEGGIVMAASMTLKEQVRFDEGGIASRSWAEYPIMRFSEVPEITCTVIDRPDEPSLGAGECTMGPTAAAIGNAVADVLGVRLRDMPLTRERIMTSLLAAR